jgi:uncharacterized damage-inducible protein DinB
MIEILLQLFQRDLEKLKTEITFFKDEKKIWEISGDIKNSAGNLCLHLCGNLQHFIGAVLGISGYVRNRDAEFSRKDIPIREPALPAGRLEAEIELATKVVEKTLKGLKEDDLQKTYPINVFGYEMTTEYFLTHLTTHLNYHLGQINYHRRLLDI